MFRTCQLRGFPSEVSDGHGMFDDVSPTIAGLGPVAGNSRRGWQHTAVGEIHQPDLSADAGTEHQSGNGRKISIGAGTNSDGPGRKIFADLTLAAGAGW